MLRALLPSVEALPPFTWHDDFEPVFIEMKPQHLTRIVVGFPEEWSEAGTFSSKVLKAAPALESVELTFLYQDEGVCTLADRLRRDDFPNLKTLHFFVSPILDIGVVALAETLLEATQTFLTNLVFYDVGMSDKGITALSYLVTEGRMEELEELDISENDAVTEKGMIALARAINVQGLPELNENFMLKLISMTDKGISAITHSLIKGCPRLQKIDLTGSVSNNDSHFNWIAGMLESEGSECEVKVVYDTPDDDDDDDE